MPNQLNFTLQFSHDYDTDKTRLKLDFIPPFSNQLDQRTEIPVFDPAKLRQALDFVSDKVVTQIAEYLRKEYFKNKKSAAWTKRFKSLNNWKTLHEQMDKLKAKGGTPAALKKLEDQAKELREEVESLGVEIKAEVEAMMKIWTNYKDSAGNQIKDANGTVIEPDLERLTSIFFEQLSPPQSSLAIYRIANTDVPPPRWP